MEEQAVYKSNCDLESCDRKSVPSMQNISNREQYSVFTTRQRKMILIAGSFAAFFSPISSNIYFPALNTIAKDLRVSITQINLTVTTYQVGIVSSKLLLYYRQTRTLC